MRYSIKAFEAASASVIAQGIASEGAKATWATLAAKGIAQGKLTLEAVQAALIAAHCATDKKLDATEVKLSHINPTTRGWYYDLARVVEAGATQRVANGEPLTTVRRETKPTAKGKGKGKGSRKTGNSSKRIVPLNEAIAAIRHYVAAAKSDNDLQNGLAANSELAAMLSDLAAMDKAVSARLAKAKKPRKRA